MKSVLLLAAWSLLACLGCSPRASTTTTDLGRPTTGPSVIEITAESLGEEYAADSDKAEKKYLGKTMRVTGTIDLVIDEMIYLETGKKAKDGRFVKMPLRFPKEADVKAYSKGQRIVVEGQVGMAGLFGPPLTEPRVLSVVGN